MQNFANKIKSGAALITSFITPPILSPVFEWDMSQINQNDLLLQKIIYLDILNAKFQCYRRLALALDTSTIQLQDVLNGHCFFVDEQANDLSQLFLVFFGRTFFKNFTLIRRFLD